MIVSSLSRACPSVPCHVSWTEARLRRCVGCLVEKVSALTLLVWPAFCQSFPLLCGAPVMALGLFPFNQEKLARLLAYFSVFFLLL
jgi:hypothetical protein